MHASVAFPTDEGMASVMIGPRDMVIAEESHSPGRFARNVRESPETLGNGVSLWFRVPDVDAYHAFVEENGATILEGPTDQFWGDRTISVEAPDGYVLMFASSIEDFEAPPDMGETDGEDLIQATAPGTVATEVPGA